ncbi:MAG: hypothetical protein AAB408_02320 [Patescibacteria group bacterium]
MSKTELEAVKQAGGMSKEEGLIWAAIKGMQSLGGVKKLSDGSYALRAVVTMGDGATPEGVVLVDCGDKMAQVLVVHSGPVVPQPLEVGGSTKKG